MTATQYLAALSFAPDRFQIEAAAAIDREETVVVTAPTGSGKTVVAEAAIHRSLLRGERAMYTTPIKALSNQKHAELVGRYGRAGVGLLTGDNSINPEAPVIVMTTEVLRNMMYAESPDLDDVGVVILDEVHYLQDRERGAVWEEIIIHLDRSIPLVCLSATIANSTAFAGWIEERRGPTTLVTEEERPVPLEVSYLVRDRFSGHELRLFPAFSGPRPNDRLASILRRDRGRRRRYAPPRRHETCAYLEQRGLLPAIYFIFSRKGCEAAARTVVDRGLRLTSSSEADQIDEFARRATAHIADEDLEVLGFSALLELLRRGVAPHHAGMVPAIKELVEILFTRGLVKLVFATETLSVGINMPARTVVLEQLSKFTGDGHETLQPGDFTQLTGRAGRRGLDVEGTAVVLHSEYLDFERVVGIAGRGSHPLRSSFRPSYNMGVNLVARYDRPRAEELLGASFAEYDRSQRRNAQMRELADDEARLSELRELAEHPTVDIWARLADEGQSHTARMAEFVAATRPGSVLEWEERGRTRRVAVIAVGRGKQPRVLAVTAEGEDRRFASGKLPGSLKEVGAIDLPRPFRPRDAGFRSQVARRLAGFRPVDPPRPVAHSDLDDAEDLSRHLEAARTARRLERRIDARRRQASSVGPGILRRFEARSKILQKLGYTKGWKLTTKGQGLRTIYNEIDLVLAESLAAGLWSGLDPAALAGLASAFTFQPRHSDGPATWPDELAAIGKQVEEIRQRIVHLEREAHIDVSRPVDPGFAGQIMAWANGSSLGDLFEDAEPAIGDFVRNVRQLIDLLRQIEDVPGVPPGGVASALRMIDRGVVAAAGAS